MKAGFYIDELEEGVGTDNIEIAAIWFADQNHEITDGDDVDFEVFVEDDKGVIHQFDMGTDFDPVYHVKSSKLITLK